MHTLTERRAIIKEYTIKVPRLGKLQVVLRNLLGELGWTYAVSEMPVGEHPESVGNACRIITFVIGKAMLEPAQKKCAVNEDRRCHQMPEKVVPGSGLELMSALASASRRQTGDGMKC